MGQPFVEWFIDQILMFYYAPAAEAVVLASGLRAAAISVNFFTDRAVKGTVWHERHLLFQDWSME